MKRIWQNFFGLFVSLALLTPENTLAFTYVTCMNGDESIVNEHSGEAPVKWQDESHNSNSNDEFFTIEFKLHHYVGPNFSNAWNEAIANFNKNPSKFRFATSVGYNLPKFNNGVSEVWFASKDDNWPSAAETVVQRDCETNSIISADIVFNGFWRPSFTSWTDPDAFYITTSKERDNLRGYNGFDHDANVMAWTENPFSFHAIAMHELGHAMGLIHEPDVLSLMGSHEYVANTNGTVVNYFIDEDTANGAEFLYGTTSMNFEDLSVKHWKNGSTSSSAGGSVSTGIRTGLYKEDGSPLCYDTIDGEGHLDNVYKFDLGQKIVAEFTLENNGKTSQTANIKFVLSKNTTILPNRSSDIVLGTFTKQIDRDPADLYTQTLTIPSSSTTLPYGFYWLGIYVDYNSQIAEANELNNATYTPVKVVYLAPSNNVCR